MNTTETKMQKTKVPRLSAMATAMVSAFAATALFSNSASAVEIDTGNPDLSVRWDNTIKAGTIYRLKDADPALADSFRLLVPGVPASAFPQALNFNSGDDNFRKKGIVSERLDVLSEFDVVYQKNFGLRVSAAAWYDHKYHQTTQATEATNGQSPINEFPASTRKIAGQKAEVLDAFIFGGFDLGEGRKLTARLGRHALQYGESLFYGDNGIARAQGPIDINKLLSSPNAQFKEIIRPVPQVSAQLQLSPTVSVGGYYQFRWEEDRLAPAGSYFSTANIPWGSSQSELASIGPTNYLLSAGGDTKPKNSGQFGLQLKLRLDETDLGFYAAQFHDKDGQLYGRLATPPSPTTPVSGGSWFYVFPESVKVYGASASHSIGDFNIAAEASVRDNMPLRSTNMLYGFFPGQAQPHYATGRTAHLNLSTLATFGPSFLARESSLVAEIAWNRVLKTNDPSAELDKGRTREATAIQAIFTPSYRQALPGLDLSVPIGVRYTVNGNSSVTAWDAKGVGSATLGIDGNYLGVWQFSLNYTNYIGKAVPFVDYSGLATGGSAIFGLGNNLKDRDYLSLSLRRTF
jgi:hypothetical protein